MKFSFFFLLLISSFSLFAQKGITYQAVILNPEGEELPGKNNSVANLIDTDICLQFTLMNGSTIEYQEIQKTKTDHFGMVNLIIGEGEYSTGTFDNIEKVIWNNNVKSLVVALDSYALCTQFIEISNQPFTAIPFAYFSINNVANNPLIAANTATKITYDEKGLVTNGTNATTADIFESTDKNYITDAEKKNIAAIAASSTNFTTNINGNATTVTTVPILNGDLVSDGITNTIALSDVGVIPSIYGSATTVPVFEVDSKGRVIKATNIAITGTSPEGSSLAQAHILVGNSSNVAASVAVKGDITLDSTGETTINKVGGKPIVLGGNFTTSGGFDTELVSTASTRLQLPPAGTLATLDEPEILTRKTFVAPNIGTPNSGSAINLTNIPVQSAVGLLPSSNGGTGINNNGKTIELGGNLKTLGAFETVLSLTGPTEITLPVTGTLATLEGFETLTNKSLVDTYLGTPVSGNAINLTQIPLKNSEGILSGTNGGTGINNGLYTLTLGGDLRTSGTFSSTLRSVDTTDITLPVKGTLATLDEAEELKNKTLIHPILKQPDLGDATGASLIVTGQLSSIVAQGVAPLVVNSTTPVANLSIGGNAATVTTNANLVGDVTSLGNTTSIGLLKVTNSMLAGGIDLPNKVSGVLAIANGGTGSTIQNFVDLSSVQTVAGIKTFSSQLSSTVATGTAPLVVTSTTPVANLSIGGNAATVTTNAPLTGAITSDTSNIASLGSFTSSNLATALTDETGTGSAVLSTAPTLVNPILGAATATSINKLMITPSATEATLTIAQGKTLTANNTITLEGQDGSTMTFPTSNATIARTDAAQTFTGGQTFSSTIIGSVTGSSGTATSLNGGVAGSIPYQTAQNTTAFLAPGTSSNLVMLLDSNKLPSWGSVVSDISPATDLTTGTIKLAGDLGGIASGGTIIDSNKPTLGKGVVSYSKIQDVSSMKILGNTTGASSAVQEVDTTGSGGVVLSAGSTINYATLNGVSYNVNNIANVGNDADGVALETGNYSVVKNDYYLINKSILNLTIVLPTIANPPTSDFKAGRKFVIISYNGKNTNVNSHSTNQIIGFYKNSILTTTTSIKMSDSDPFSILTLFFDGSNWIIESYRKGAVSDLTTN
jgi:hypothetical protein